jgi:hypothetical protein
LAFICQRGVSPLKNPSLRGLHPIRTPAGKGIGFSENLGRKSTFLKFHTNGGSKLTIAKYPLEKATRHGKILVVFSAVFANQSAASSQFRP